MKKNTYVCSIFEILNLNLSLFLQKKIVNTKSKTKLYMCIWSPNTWENELRELLKPRSKRHNLRNKQILLYLGSRLLCT